MAKQLQIRGGTTAQHSTFTGAVREITVDTDKDVVVVHDGTTVGGFPLAKQTSVDSKVAKVTSTDNAVPKFNGTTGELQNSGVVIDDSNNVGIGVTPNINTTLPTLFGNYLMSAGMLESYSYAAASRQGAVDKYLTTGKAASCYLQANGVHSWKTASSGTAGNPITWIDAMTLDASGSLGIRVNTIAGAGALQISNIDSLGFQGPYGYIWANVKYTDGYRYVTSAKATAFDMFDGAFIWKTAPSGTAGNAITFTTAMTLGASGNLVVGGSLEQGRLSVYSANVANGTNIALFGNSAGGGTLKILNTDGADYGNTALTGLAINKNVATGRSINAAGLISGQGADYAEYEYSNDITIAKGQIVGFKADGTLTDKYSEAVRFAIKSTNPSFAGGDTWGNEDIVGKRPEQPVRKLDKTEQVKIEDSEEFETVVIEAGDTDAEWEAIEAKYKEDLDDFGARLEVERQKVDRIAYAGKVPVNVYGATAGQYIVAIEKDGGIDGLAVNKADMTFAQYQDAIGRVNKILDDGRAEVAVIIH